MVFYFTGTGNSLYIAKQIENDPISIPQAIHRGNQEYSADSIGIVAPVYGHEVPSMVKEFLKNAVFHTDYFYMILTYGNRHGGAAELAKKLCDECGITIHYIKENMAAILADLAACRNRIAEVTDADRTAHRQFLDRMSQMPADAWQHLLRVTETCVGCGICEKVCPSASVRVTDGKAIHIPGNCQTCLACIHACPHKVIRLTIPEVNPNARYRNEYISLQEIIERNGKCKQADRKGAGPVYSFRSAGLSGYGRISEYASCGAE